MKGLLEELGGALFFIMLSRFLYEAMTMFLKTAESMV